jgi:hypothetical protein
MPNKNLNMKNLLKGLENIMNLEPSKSPNSPKRNNRTKKEKAFKLTKATFSLKNNKTKKSKSPKKGPKAHKKSSPTESRRVTRGEKKFLERVMNENNTNMSKKYREERNAEITRRAKEKAKNNNNE